MSPDTFTLSSPSTTSPSLIQTTPYVGELYAFTGTTAAVHVHAFHIDCLGGLPRGCLLLAAEGVHPTRGLLLRVLEPLDLPDSAWLDRVRVQSAAQVAGDISQPWNSPAILDTSTAHQLAFSGVRCRVLGTVISTASRVEFSSDTDSILLPHGWKVFKPYGDELAALVSPAYADSVRIGMIRYSASLPAAASGAVFSVRPAAFIGQKTAVFGMTRTGKSNTTKMIVRALYHWRFQRPDARVGQLIFDINGEYATTATAESAAALHQLWSTHPAGKPDECVVYGSEFTHQDPGSVQRVTLLNMLETEHLPVGKSLLDAALAGDTAKFIQQFRHVRFDPPSFDGSPTSYAARKRYERRVLVYRTLLVAAGCTPASTLRPKPAGLFADAIINGLASSTSALAADHHAAARLLRIPQPTWSQMATICRALDNFIHDRASGYSAIEAELIQQSSSGEAWADEDLKKLLALFRYPNGLRQLGILARHHTPDTGSDYAHDIYADLAAGRVVIVDQSYGDPIVNIAAAERIMQTVFQRQQQAFRTGSALPDIVIYIDEAHTVLPARNDDDLRNIWVRTAKEGAKYHLGLVYATQEVTSVQRNIVKNTANWFVGHLNNRMEVSEVSNYYDFADFAEALLRVQERGFVRVKLIDLPFVVSVQIDPYEVPSDAVSE